MVKEELLSFEPQVELHPGAIGVLESFGYRLNGILHVAGGGFTPIRRHGELLESYGQRARRQTILIPDLKDHNLLYDRTQPPSTRAIDAGMTWPEGCVNS